MLNVCPSNLTHSIATVLVERKNHNVHGHFCSADAAFEPAYQSMLDGKTFTDSAACKTAFAAYNCILIASKMNSGPCDASGALMLPCHELCTAYVQACKVGGGISTRAPSPKIFYSALLPQAPLCISILRKHFKTKNDQDCSAIHEINHMDKEGLANPENKQPPSATRMQKQLATLWPIQRCQQPRERRVSALLVGTPKFVLYCA
jgi:hypothetical protein